MDIKVKGSTIKIKRAPTKRLKTAIAMYMPASVQVTYGAELSDTPNRCSDRTSFKRIQQFTIGGE